MDAIAGKNWLDKRWKTSILALWLVLSALFILLKIPDITALSLADTDDNLRLAQVRALLAGQGWFDLAQYRLAPPDGANIHWSRLPDLPIAGLILLLRPFLGAAAENWAVAIVPLIPFGIGLAAIAVITRRLVDPKAWPLAILVTLCAGSLMPMWMPMRIDHHGWQLALLAVAVAGLVDPQKRRGGLTSGIATALSLAIGLEMLAYLALIGAATTLFWVRHQAEAPRVASYGASLGGAAALGFAIFASEANRAPVCDALSPVWLSVIAIAGGVLVLLSLTSPEDWRKRLGLIAASGAILLVGMVLVWPDCLSRPEGVSSDLKTLWLDTVNEARPLYLLDWRAALAVIALPLSGLAGYALATVRSMGTARFPAWLAMTVLALCSSALLFWQVRLGPSAQLLAIPGAAALGWSMLPELRAPDNMLARTFNTMAGIAIMTGLYAAIPLAIFPKAVDSQRQERLAIASACSSDQAINPLGDVPAGTVFAPIDLSPRLIVKTPHSAIAGPYHRNGEAILDVIRTFQGSAESARTTIARRNADYVLICPNMAGDTVYQTEDGAGFYAELSRGDAPDWLEPVALPTNSPFRMWRVR